MPLIRNKLTGEVKQVPDHQLGDYGVTPPSVTSAPASQVSSNITTTAQDPNADYQAKSTKLKSLITGMMLQNPKQASLLKNIYDLNVPEKPKEPTAAEKKAKDDAEKAKNQSTSSIQNLLTQYGNLSDMEKAPVIGNILAKNPLGASSTYSQQSHGLYAQLKDIAGAGSGSGVRVNNYDINLWAKLLPQPGDTQDQVKIKVKTLDSSLKSKFGQGLDPEYLQQFGLTSDQKKNDSKSQGINVGGDVKNILNGVLNAPRSAYQQGVTAREQAMKGDPTGMQNANPNALIFNALKGYAGNLNKDAGQPLQGGDVVGRVGQNFKQRPVSTILDALPLLMEGSKAIPEGKVTVSTTPTEATAATTKPGLLKSIISQPKSYKNLAAKSTSAASAATKAGTKIDWGGLTDDIRSTASKELGDTPEVKQAVNQTLAEKDPGAIAPSEGANAGVNHITPDTAIDWRRQISNRNGGNFLQKAFKGNDIQGKVDNIVRRKVSEALHKSVPLTESPDTVYSFYKRIHGDVPTWVRNIAIAEAAKRGAGNIPGAEILKYLPVP